MTTPLFNTLHEAERALLDMGYQRDKARAIWRNAEGRTAKVVRDSELKFFVQTS